MGSCAVCGQTVGFTKVRLSAHAADLNVAVPLLEIAKSSWGSHPDFDVERLVAFIAAGEQLATQLHEVAHARASYVPDPRELSRWQGAARDLIRTLATTDREAIDRYSSGLSPKEARLVQSMLFGS